MLKSDYDIKSEKIVLKALLQSDKFSKKVILNRTLSNNHFAVLFHKDVLELFFKFFIKHGKRPTYNQAKHYIKKYTTYVDKYKTKEEQIRVWQRSLKRLYRKLTKSEIRNIDTSVEILDDLRKARVIKRAIANGAKQLEVGEYDEILLLFNKAIIDSRKFENAVSEGNIIDDLNYHIELDKRIKAGEFTPISTHIFGVYENDGKLKRARLDKVLSGGFYAGEVVMFVGEVNVGKSFTLMETAFCTARFEKKNSILFTIEMNKVKSQRRIYARATGIPYNRFKMGALTRKDKQKLYDWKDDWKEQKYGILEVVSFDRGAAVIDIENKVKDIENKYGEPFELIAVDYLNDLRPLGRFQSSKSWDAIGEVSWDLANLSKGYDGSRGIAAITASQKKTTQYGKSETKAGSAAMSALPEHHATIAIGIGQNDEDKLYGLHGRIRYDIFKNRDGQKDISFYTFPNFKASRIHSEKSMRQHYGEKADRL